MSSAQVFRHRLLLVLAPALLGACAEDPTFERLEPNLLVCASKKTDADKCNVALALGEVSITVEHRVPLVVRNDGDAPLEISKIAASSGNEDVVGVEPAKLEVAADEEVIVEVLLVPDALDDDGTTLTFSSDDPEEPELEVALTWKGVPAPAPILEVCLADGAGTCGSEITVDFGVVRRAQRESRTVIVRNRGDAAAEVIAVSEVAASSSVGELSIATSTRPANVPAGSEARIVVLYEPADGFADTHDLLLETTNPQAPELLVHLLGTSTKNDPPTADARDAITDVQAFETEVGDVVTLSGLGSSDPEGDPLLYAWSLQTPEQSGASLDDDSAAIVSFLPDVRGSYRAELLVYDSLGQVSEVAAVVLMQALPAAALRVELDWSSGADVDLHLVPLGSALFSDDDCYFANPRPDVGVLGDALDDPELLNDSETAPGSEVIRFITPPDGQWRIVAHYFDEAAQGPALISVGVTLDDASFPVFEATEVLPSSCSLWEVGTVSFPDAEFVVAGVGLGTECWAP